MLTDNVQLKDAAALKKQFQSDKNPEGPLVYLPINKMQLDEAHDVISRLMSGYRKSGYSGVIPFVSNKHGVKALSDEYYTVYDIIKKEADTNQLELAYLDDTYVMREYISSLDDSSRAVCKILTKYEYSCTEGQVLKRKLHSEFKLMSLVAVNDDDLTFRDLREFVKTNENGERIIEWDVPEGNWNIEEYICEPDYNANFINILDNEVSAEYLRETLGKLYDKYSDKKSKQFDIFICRNIMYAGKNRRMWHEGFNEHFKEEYGFDPSPYYTLLFRDYGESARKYKCMLMKCRSDMMIEGYMKAAAAFCAARDIFCTGFPAESKASACSWLFGDGQMLHKYAAAPGVSLPFAYLYGINGIKVAAGAADAFGDEVVTADLFNYYLTLSREIIYRESMNAFVRGVNMIFAHLGEDRTKDDGAIGENSVWGSIFSRSDDLSEYASFVSRVQTMLRGGEHVYESAILYPIHSLHSLVYLYQSSETGFEYPSTPENADYMELMNNFLNYVGIDTAFIHPDIVSEHAFTENGILYLESKNGSSVQKIKLLILPSMSLISLKTLRVIKKFFIEGGKIIATDSLPSSAFESASVLKHNDRLISGETDEDREVKEIINYIFGSEATDNRIYKMYYKNESEKGGIAYFLPANKTSVDGTDTVSADILYQATENFGIAPDVYINNMPRREFLGVVNYHLPAFMKVGIDKRLAKGCSMNYIHKRFSGCDIYYFTNTSGDAYHGEILLRGNLSPEEWNPYNGKTKKLVSDGVRFRGADYTKITLDILPSSCTFVVCPIQRTQKELARDMTSAEELPEFVPGKHYNT